MKKYGLVLMALLLVMLFFGGARADTTDVYNDSKWRTTVDGEKLPISPVVNTRTMRLGVTSFITATGSTITPLTTSTAPGLEINNLLPAIVWADGETTPVGVTFRVPPDYYSGGTFRLFCDSSSSTTPVQVDFAVYVNSDNGAWDTAATNQTPVALARGAGTPEQVTLTVATDFSVLSSGSTVNLQIWRDDVANGTGDLELYYADFYYNSNR